MRQSALALRFTSLCLLTSLPLISTPAHAGAERQLVEAINDYRADWPQVYRVPKLGGQNADYIAASLKAYKSGERKHPTMRAIAGSLTDQDMADLAAYYSAQTPTSPRNPLK